MKLRELISRTGVSKETIQFYLREGVLPKPRKRGKGQADYGENYIEIIELIKDLQEKHFLPLAVIKKILKRLKKISPSEEHFFRMQSEFFSPVGYILAQREVEGEEQFLDITGLGRKWLIAAEEWGLVTPEIRSGEKVFSSEDVAIGKVMVEFGRAGTGPEAGFDPEVLRRYKDYLQRMVADLTMNFTDHLYGKISEDKFAEKGFRNLNLMGIFLFFLFRKLAQNDTREYINQLEKQTKGDEK